jgi:hypothetical protein
MCLSLRLRVNLCLSLRARARHERRRVGPPASCTACVFARYTDVMAPFPLGRPYGGGECFIFVDIKQTKFRTVTTNIT